MKAPVNSTKIQGILDTIAPGTRISFTMIHPGSVQQADDADLERAKALFGDRLSIE